jgi:hypothetical protein
VGKKVVRQIIILKWIYRNREKLRYEDVSSSDVVQNKVNYWDLINASLNLKVF